MEVLTGGKNWMSLRRRNIPHGKQFLTKKASYADAVRKPPLSGANSKPVQKAKQWRPRISVFDRLDHGNHKSGQLATGRRSVFERIQLNSRSANNDGNSLISKKTVFDRLDFDLQRAE
jgi:hypothetical protein